VVKKVSRDSYISFYGWLLIVGVIIFGALLLWDFVQKRNLVCKQRLNYKPTTNSNHYNGISENLQDQKLNPEKENTILPTLKHDRAGSILPS